MGLSWQTRGLWLLVRLHESIKTMAHRAQTEEFGVDVGDRNPLEGGRVVAGMERGEILHLTEEEAVERLHLEARIDVDVR